MTKPAKSLSPSVFILAIALTACSDDILAEQNTLPPPPNVPAASTQAPLGEAAPDAAPAEPLQSTSRTNRIDWASARADLAGSQTANVTIQSLGDEPAPVPMLVPSGVATSQSAGNGPIIKRTSDGYFAFYAGAAYNITVNGTNQTVEVKDRERTNTDREPVFSSTMAGAQVWLTRYGADYLVEFECNTLENNMDTCIEEAEAMEIADQLTVVESR